MKKDLSHLHQKMRDTFQFQGIDMLQHGEMVSSSYKSLLTQIKAGDCQELGIDSNFLKPFLEYQYPGDIMEHYQTYHDCGKPYCRTIDSEGKQHFPGHAAMSAEIYREYFNCEQVAQLISNDMQFHTLKGDELTSWLQSHKCNRKLLCSLYLTAWAEILANSTMFGGTESTSFKIKRKSLISAGKKLSQQLNES